MGYEFILLILGAILLCVEMFFPGFGVFGISGVVMIVISAVLTFFSGPMGGMIVLSEIVILAVIVYFVLSFAKKRKLYSKIVLDEVLADSDEGLSGYDDFIGRQGTAKTALRPIGTVDFGDATLEAYSENGFINKGQYVKVVRVEKRKIYVKTVN